MVTVVRGEESPRASLGGRRGRTSSSTEVERAYWVSQPKTNPVVFMGILSIKIEKNGKKMEKKEGKNGKKDDL